MEKRNVVVGGLVVLLVLLTGAVILLAASNGSKTEDIAARDAQIENLTQEVEQVRESVEAQNFEASAKCAQAFSEAEYLVNELHRGFYAWAETAVDWSEYAAGYSYSVPTQDPTLNEVQRNLDAVGWGETYLAAAQECMAVFENAGEGV